MLNEVFMKYANRYQELNILCINEGQYHFGDSNEVNCFKIPSIWEFDGSSERDNTINTMLSFTIESPWASSKHGLSLKNTQIQMTKIKTIVLYCNLVLQLMVNYMNFTIVKLNMCFPCYRL